MITENYNPKYGDERSCKCGHSYYRHFDSYDDMRFVGCKYCNCYEFEEGMSMKKLSRRRTGRHIERELNNKLSNEGKMKKVKISETKFTKEFRKNLESKGWITFKINERFASGFPDLIAMKEGQVEFIEIKSDKNDLTKLQRFTLDKIKGAKIITKVIVFKSQLDKDEPIEWEERRF